MALLGINAAFTHAVEPGKPSKTAVVTLQLRALGAKLPAPELRNPDNLAVRLLGAQERALLREMPMGEVYADMDFAMAWRKMPEIQHRVFLHVLARTRFFDDALHRAVGEGAKQLVILGAGYDSRAYRLQRLLRNTTVFELDYPPTQEYKRRRVREALGKAPVNLRYVPIDFSQQDLGAVLQEAGYRADRKTFFLWEGVTMYIPEAAVTATLRFVASHSAPGSQVAFDYEHEDAVRGNHNDAVLKASNARLASIGEPHIFGFPGENAEAFVGRMGLLVREDLSTEEVTRRYLTGDDGVTLGEERWSNGLCLAEVPA